ncbi:MAG TPA: Calx-beta domain-containing protein [Polyangiaceae bacterium]|nr:Calx-beta domain-containing protein [Polyangiaceae bacterium]
MSRFGMWQRVLGLLFLVLISVFSCQKFYGEFRVDDGAFGAQTGPILLSPTKGLFTTEWGGKATFTIVCDHQPTGPVTVAIRSSNTDEGTVSPSSVTFSTEDWRAPQVVTVTGVDDTLMDGSRSYKIITDPAVSEDPSYNRKNPIDLELVNVDNETAGITVVPRSGLVTSEAGGQDTFTVVLNSKPGKDVTIELKSDTPDEGTVSPESLLFTTVNWMAPQLVTVTGVDDGPVPDGPHPYKIAVTTKSEDETYAHVAPVNVDVVNQDNDTAGLTVALLSGLDPNDPTKLRTSERGDSATFSVALNSLPSTNVEIQVYSDTESEGTVSPASLTFTPDNWNAPQVVTVMGVEDLEHRADGDQPYLIVLKSPTDGDPGYVALPETDVPVTNVDADKPGFTLMLLSGIDPQHAGQLLTSEDGATATFSLALNSQPSGPVSVQVASGLPTEAKVSPGVLTFTPDNWSAPQIVSVKGQDDPPGHEQEQDGSPQFYVTTRVDPDSLGDPAYALDPPDVLVTNQDNDSAGVKVVLVKGIDPGVPNRLMTDEGGATATFTLALSSRPTDDVTISLSSSNINEGSLWTSTFVFTRENYSAPQTVTIAGVEDDSTVDGNQPYVINIGPARSTDPNFDGKFASQVQLINIDNDTPGVFVAPQKGLVTSEGGKSDSFSIRLQSKPSADVTIGIKSSNEAEGKPNVSSVTFTEANWNANQIVTVTGQEDDGAQDGDQPYKIVLSPASNSADQLYKNIDPADVSVTNQDNDSAGITVNPTSGLVTTEKGGKATFTIALRSKPVDAAGAGTSVKFYLTSSKPAEGSVSPTSLTFTAVNWRSAQTVTVTGLDDDVADGDQPYLVNLLSQSTDANYNNQSRDVAVTNIDDDSAGLVITPTPTQTPAHTTEKGGKSTFTVALKSKPAGEVSFMLSVTDSSEGKVSPGTLTFTSSNWKTAQIVTVTGLDDAEADGDQDYTVHLSNADSPADKNYAGKFATDLPFINEDDDVPGIDVQAPPTLTTTEYGGTAKFTVALKSQPKGGYNVSIAVSSSMTSEGKVSPSTLVFTPSNWSTPQTVTVTGVDDSVADGNQAYEVRLANAMSMDSDYSGMFGMQLPAQNVDDDQVGYLVSGPASNQTTEKGDSVTFTVVLTSQPASPSTVTLGISSTNTSEGKVSPSSLLFSASDWNVPQTVTVTGVDDKKADGDVSYKITFMADPDYKAPEPSPITLINVNDDAIGVVVTPTTCATTPGATATFSISLSSQPSANVTIPLHSDTPTAGLISVDSVTFKPSGTGSWDKPQTVTVTGQNDGSVGMMTSYTIITDPASAPGETTGYDGYTTIADVMCTNTTP